MPVDRFIALRYLISRKQFGFVTVISLISIVGVTIGVMALVVVLSVFNGFNGLVTAILVNFDPHVRVESPSRGTPIEYGPLMEFLDRHPRVKGYSPFVSGKAMVIARSGNRVVNVRGIDGKRIGAVSGLKQRIVLGELELDETAGAGMVIGLTLADRLGVVVGDTVSVVSPAGSEMALLQFGQPIVRRIRINGIYESNNKEYDAYYAYVSLSAAQRLFNTVGQIHGVELRGAALTDANRLKRALEKEFGDRYRILTWYDLHRDLYSVMQIERWMAYVILSLIIAVATFNLLGSLTMTVIEKTRDIGILKAMGTTEKGIQRIFLNQGIVVGVVGAVLGILLGVSLVLLQQKYALFPLDPSVYIIPAIPTELKLSDLLLVSVTAILFSTLAALYPARRAARLLPADAIRWE